MTRSTVHLFGLETVNDYLTLSDEAVRDFEREQDSVLRGFAAILALNHLPDWLRYKLSQEERCRLGLPLQPREAEVSPFFEAKNTDITVIRQIANGFKHLRPVHSTQRVEGYGAGPYGIGPFGASYLLIDLGENKEAAERWYVGLDLCQRVLNWWQGTLEPILIEGGN